MTTNSGPDAEPNRNDLVQRLELMESMIAEGRHTTMRCGWIFILWGAVNLVGTGWQMSKYHNRWVWQICLAIGLVLQFAGIALQKRRDRCRQKSMQDLTVRAIWSMMGITMLLYIGAAMLGHFAWQLSYVAALGFFVGMAHAISAFVLRWRAQGIVAVIWWAGGVAMFFSRSPRAMNIIFLVEMGLGMIAFGIYAMVLERSGRGWANGTA